MDVILFTQETIFFTCQMANHVDFTFLLYTHDFKSLTPVSSCSFLFFFHSHLFFRV